MVGIARSKVILWYLILVIRYCFDMIWLYDGFWYCLNYILMLHDYMNHCFELSLFIFTFLCLYCWTFLLLLFLDESLAVALATWNLTLSEPGGCSGQLALQSLGNFEKPWCSSGAWEKIICCICVKIRYPHHQYQHHVNPNVWEANCFWPVCMWNVSFTGHITLFIESCQRRFEKLRFVDFWAVAILISTFSPPYLNELWGFLTKRSPSMFITNRLDGWL